jgi:hypothetical protein
MWQPHCQQIRTVGGDIFVARLARIRRGISEHGKSRSRQVEPGGARRRRRGELVDKRPEPIAVFPTTHAVRVPMFGLDGRQGARRPGPPWQHRRSTNCSTGVSPLRRKSTPWRMKRFGKRAIRWSRYSWAGRTICRVDGGSGSLRCADGVGLAPVLAGLVHNALRKGWTVSWYSCTDTSSKPASRQVVRSARDGNLEQAGRGAARRRRRSLPCSNDWASNKRRTRRCDNWIPWSAGGRGRWTAPCLEDLRAATVS